MYAAYIDNELWELIKTADDQKAFEQVYDRYRESMFAVAYANIKNYQTSEDIVHEIFISLWNRRKVTEIQKLEGYLVTAVKFLCITYIRKATRVKVQLSGDALPEVVDVLNPEEVYRSRYLDNLYRYQIDQLPLQCRLVYQYSREQGLKTPEIAVKMDISPRTVEYHLGVALKRLGKLFKPISMFFFLWC